MPKPDLKQLIELNKSRNNGVLTCYLCPKVLDEAKRMSYVIEHKDNNRKNNNINNLDIACRPCNKLKNPGLIAKYHKVKGLTLNRIYTQAQKNIYQDKLQVNSVAMAKHLYGEPRFREFAMGLLHERQFVLLSDLVIAGSEYADVQEERGYKYAAKMYSIAGNLEKYFNDNDKQWYVRLKDSYLKSITEEQKRKFDR